MRRCTLLLAGLVIGLLPAVSMAGQRYGRGWDGGGRGFFDRGDRFRGHSHNGFSFSIGFSTGGFYSSGYAYYPPRVCYPPRVYYAPSYYVPPPVVYVPVPAPVVTYRYYNAPPCYPPSGYYSTSARYYYRR
jgi:hypothetical protein